MVPVALQTNKLPQHFGGWQQETKHISFELACFSCCFATLQVVKGKIWTFEQPQALGFSYVAINVRMTVIKLKSGGLWVHAPIAPTGECMRLLKELGAPVEFIILPTFAYEHKIFVGPFARKFPKAKVYTAPNQWSWPINLPAPLFGIFARGTIENDDRTTPWADEIEQKLFRPPDVGRCVECSDHQHTC